MGHSLGEYTALVATGALELADAMRLVRLRGKLMQQTVGSRQTAMKAVLVSAGRLEGVEEAMSRISGQMPDGQVAELSNINSRSQVRSFVTSFHYLN